MLDKRLEGKSKLGLELIDVLTKYDKALAVETGAEVLGTLIGAFSDGNKEGCVMAIYATQDVIKEAALAALKSYIEFQEKEAGNVKH